MEEWLNDTTVDGFLGNLRSPEKFIKMDSKWNASKMSDTSKPPSKEEGGTIVVDPVGLLNKYEYVMTGGSLAFLHNRQAWFTLTPDNSANNGWAKLIYVYQADGVLSSIYSINSIAARPSINLKPEIKIVAGDGTESNPYRIMGDNDTDLQGTKLNIRYSGEYIKFGTGENNLYRIVSHETPGLTKITSAEPLKENSKFKTISFGEASYSSTNTIGSFLNGEYLTSGDYLTEEQVNMIEDNTTWYLGTVGNATSYKLAKYKDTNMSGYTINTETKVGLLRLGELMASQFNISTNNPYYWLLNSANDNAVGMIYPNGSGYNSRIENYNAIKPALNLKSNVIITGGDGTKEKPFTLELQ